MRTARMTVTRAVALTLVLAACDTRGGGRSESGGEVSSTPALRESAYEWWDTDRDQRLTEPEFARAVRRRAYDRWNTTPDAGLDLGETAAGLYRLWDRDQDGRIVGEEWVTEQSPWNRPGLDYGGLDVSDANRDGWLDHDEVRARLDSAGYFRSWDTDGNRLLDADELGRGLFQTWDTSHDGAIDEDEWDRGVGGPTWS